MQIQQPSRLIPSRGAALALFAIDAILILAWLLFPQHSLWFVIAYLPLLLTATIGIVMSGHSLLATKIVFISTSLMMLSLWAVFRFQLVLFDHFDEVLKVAGVIMCLLGIGSLIVSTWGWIRFFQGRQNLAAARAG